MRRSVGGCYAIAPHILERAEAPRRIGRGAPARIPAILLAKLAVRADHFTPLPADPRRLVLKLSTVAQALDLPWP